MKILTLTIGDVHGRNNWKKYADIEHLLQADPDAAGFGPFEPEYDKYIFIGDYLDAYDKTNDEIFDNLSEILRFKSMYDEYVILLHGNHEMQYLLDNPSTKAEDYRCSGFRPEMHFDLYELLRQNRDKFQLAFQIDNTIWTHAGIHHGWYNFVFKKQFKAMMEFEPGRTFENIAEELNYAFACRLECIFDVDWFRGGSKRIAGPLWLDRKRGMDKPLYGYHQIVGHTPTFEIEEYINKRRHCSIVYCDVQVHQNEPYVRAFG